MSTVQPWMVVVGTLAGMAVGGALASAWWWSKLKRARRLIDRTVDIVAKLIAAASFPLMKPLRASALKLMDELKAP